MQHNNVTMTIVINAGREHITREYTSPSDRQTYVEGRDGSNFIIRLKNDNNFRILVIPSVDGLSVLDGKPAGEQSGGYIIPARAKLDIPGWVVDNGTAAKFFFSGLKANGEDNSYVATSGSDTTNKGVIGIKVIQEKHFSKIKWDQLRRAQAPIAPTPLRATFGDGTLNSCSFNEPVFASAAVQTLGTGFGEATDFKTEKTEFQRGDLLTVMVIYYGDARELKKRGIDISQPEAKLPNAFPSDIVGCTPPATWANNR